MNLPSLSLDLPLFLQQKATLARIVHDGPGGTISRANIAHLKGILSLLDHIHDSAIPPDRADIPPIMSLPSVRTRKVVGPFTVAEYVTPVPGLPRFVVIRSSDGKRLDEFRRYKPAVLWAKAQRAILQSPVTSHQSLPNAR